MLVRITKIIIGVLAWTPLGGLTEILLNPALGKNMEKFAVGGILNFFPNWGFCLCQSYCCRVGSGHWSDSLCSASDSSSVFPHGETNQSKWLICEAVSETVKMSQDILGCVCVGEGAGQAVPWWDSEVPHISRSPVSQPGRAASHWHTRGFAPFSPNPAPEWSNDHKSHLGERPMKARGAFRVKHKAITLSRSCLFLVFLSGHSWNPGVGSCMCAFLDLFCLFFLIPSCWNILSNLSWNGFKVC